MEFMSEQTNELFTALSKAQGELTVAQINKVNPHFKSRYSDLQSYFSACRGPLSKNGLSVIQTIEDKEGRTLLITTLGHCSGQWIKSSMPINPTKNDMQGFGSALSYARRYSLASIIGLASGEEDDDGNEAVAPSPTIATMNQITPDQLSELNKLLALCTSKYKETLMEYLRKPPHNAKTLAEMPINIYEKVLSSIKAEIDNEKRGKKYAEAKEAAA